MDERSTDQGLRVSILAMLVFISFYPLVATSQDCLLDQVEASTPVSLEQFGSACDLHGSTLFVGTPGDKVNGLGNTGSVSVYQQTGTAWAFTQLLTASDFPSGGFNFGNAVDSGGTVLIVGARNEADLQNNVFNRGAGYLFELQGMQWLQSAKLLASDPLAKARLGSSVATDGVQVALGAPGWSSPVGCVGKIYIYEKLSGVWTETQSMAAPNNARISFGSDLDYAGTDLIVGADFFADTNGVLTGAFFVLRDTGSGYTIVDQVTPSDGLLGTLFGHALDADDDLLVVGALSDDTFGFDNGAAYVFERQADGTWLEMQKLFSPNPSFGGFFGYSVAVCDRQIVVGAALDGSNSQGRVYVFDELQPNVWTVTHSLDDPQAASGQQLGHSVALENGIVAGGAPFADSSGVSKSGELSVWSLNPSQCRPLSADPAGISLSAGGLQTMSLDYGPTAAGLWYWTVGTFSGTSPGFVFGPLLVPINPDSYFFSTLPSGAPPLSGNVSTLDSVGQATTLLTVPPLSDPSLVGTTVNHASILFSLSPLVLYTVSNTVDLTLDP